MSVVEHRSALASPFLDPAQSISFRVAWKQPTWKQTVQYLIAVLWICFFLWDSAPAKQMVQHFKKQNSWKNRKPSTTGR